MSRISTYEIVPVPKLADKLIGTSVGGEIEDVTYNFTLGELLNLFLPNIPANNLQGVLDYGNEATQDIILNGTIFTNNLEVANTATILNSYFTEEIHITGGLYDSLDSIGTPGQVLISTGDSVEWYTIPEVIPTLQQVLTSGNTADVDIVLDANLEALTISADNANIATQLTIQGVVVDYNESSGMSGQVLSSTSTTVEWIDLPVYSATSPLLFDSMTGIFSIQVANNLQGGYLTANDWVTFDGKQNAGNYITSLTGEATATGPGAASVTLNNASVTSKILSGLNITGGSITATDSILTAFGKVQNQINGLIGGVVYQGVWDALTNTPTLTSSVGIQGHYYVVNVAGTTNLNGITDWKVGDWAIFSGGAWNKVDNTDAVTSVNGQVGAVSLTTDNIPEGITNLYFLNSRARAALSFAAGSGNYNSTTGVITIPTNTNQLTNGANYITLASLSGTAPIQYNSSTGAISITQASALSNGFLSSTDWTTFNSKQEALSGTGIVKSTGGVISYLTDNSSNWNTAYNDSIVSAAVTGTTTKTLTLNQQDGGTVTASWTDTDTGLTSVGVSMPAAFNVANSPLTANGTIAITGAGNATQYIRGDGALATLPTNGGGGGASVSYYLNGSINQGTIGGVTYYEMNKTPIIGAGTDFSRNTNGYIASFLTDANDPALLVIPAGNWNFETYFNASSGGGSPTFYIELYKYNGTTFTLIASNSTTPKLINDGTSIEAYFSALAVPQTTLTLTDRLAIRIYVTTAGRTITLHTENGHLCQVITTFTTGLTALNGLTSQVQYFATGTSGTDFNILSASATHTFNLPTASATNRGALSSGDWSVFNAKQNALTLTTTGSSGAATFIGATLNVPNYTLSGLGGVPLSRTLTINGTVFDLSADRSWNVGTVTSVSALTIGTSGTDISSTVANSTTTPIITLNVPTASGSNRGALSSADWTTFNNKQNALTNPITGTGTSGQVAYFNGTSSLTSNAAFAFTPTSQLLVNNSVTAASAIARGTNLTSALTAAANNDALVGLDINPTFSNGAFTGVTNRQIRIQNPALTFADMSFGLLTGGGGYNSSFIQDGNGLTIGHNSSSRNFRLQTNATSRIFIAGGGNVVIGSETDAGFRLDVNGTARVQSTLTASGQNNNFGTTTLDSYAVFNSSTYNGGAPITVIANGTGYNVARGHITMRSLTNTNRFTLGIHTTSGFQFIEAENILAINSSTLAIVAIGTATPNNSAQLQVDSTVRGFLPPRMTSAQRTAIASPAAGLMVYDNTLNDPFYFNGTVWTMLQDAITLTTTGTSGAATLTGATLNIPQYADASGSTAYIQNGTSQQASSNFRISGIGKAITSFDSDYFRLMGNDASTVGKWNGGSGLFSGYNIDITGGNYVHFSTGTLSAISNDNSQYFRIWANTSQSAGATATTRFQVSPTLTTISNDANLLSNLYIGSTTSGTSTVLISKNPTSSAGYTNVLISNEVQSSVSASIVGFRTLIGSATGTTLTAVHHFTATQGTWNGNTMTATSGFRVTNSLGNATNTYAAKFEIASGTGRWNVFADGTASNHLQGNTLIGTTTDNGARLQVAGNLTTTLDATVGQDLNLTRTSAQPAITFTSGIRFVNSGSFTATLGVPSANTFSMANLSLSGTLGVTGAATLSNLAGTGTRMVVADANGLLSTQAIGSGAITGTGTTNYLPKFTGSTTVGNSNLINDASGNLGLGVTPSAWSNPFKVIEGGGSGFQQFIGFQNNDNSLKLGVNHYYNGSAYVYTNNGLSSRLDINADKFIFNTAPSGTAGNAISFTQAMTLGANGNLLVGTTTDVGYKLDVNGEGRFNNTLTLVAPTSSTALALLGRSTDNFSALRFLSNNAATVYATIYSNASDLIFENNGSERLKIASTGAATFSGTLGINGVADNVKGGQYTATVSDRINFSGVTSVFPTFTRVGNVVVAQGAIQINPTTANTYTEFRINLPSGWGDAGTQPYCGSGTLVDGGSTTTNNDSYRPVSVSIIGNVAYISFYPRTTSTASISFSFQYILP